MVIVGAEESMSTIGTIANIVARKRRKKNVVEAKTRMTMIDLFFVYCGAMVDIGTNISVPTKMIKPMRFRSIPHRQFLSLFINNKLGIFAVFLVGADQEEVHIGGYTEASVPAEFTFKLTAEVGCVIVEEFDLLSVGERIFQIDKRTG
jgi:hypothetical protein